MVYIKSNWEGIHFIQYRRSGPEALMVSKWQTILHTQNRDKHGYKREHREEVVRKRENMQEVQMWVEEEEEGEDGVGKEVWEEKADEKSRFSREVWLPYANDT